MAATISINFDNPMCTFHPREIITGHVSLSTDHQILASGLTLSLHGEAYVRWIKTTQNPSTQNHQTNSKEYRNHETYFNTIICLPIPTDKEENFRKTFTRLPAGYNANIPFSFQLPSGIPSSCKLAHGGVNYFAEATLKIKETRLSSSVEPVKAEFSVLGELDLAIVKGVLLPIHVQQQKQFDHWSLCFLCLGIKNGELELDLKLGKRGFVPGEAISFSVNFSNSSHVTIEQLEAYLTQEIHFVTFGKEKLSSRKVNSVTYSNQLDPNANGCWMDSLNIPQNAYLTDLGGCRVIRISYIFTVNTKSTKGGNFKMKVPITIGSVNSTPGIESGNITESYL